MGNASDAVGFIASGVGRYEAEDVQPGRMADGREDLRDLRRVHAGDCFNITEICK